MTADRESLLEKAVNFLRSFNGAYVAEALAIDELRVENEQLRELTRLQDETQGVLHAKNVEQREKIESLQNLLGEWLLWFGSTNNISNRTRRALDVTSTQSTGETNDT